MKVGIVILNYNDSDTTIKMIKQVEHFKQIDHILIVDNCSTDNSFNILSKYQKDNIEVIKTKANKGYANGNNEGIKYLENKCDLIVISNPDITIKEKDFNKLINIISNNIDIALLAPNVNERNRISRGWKLPTWINDLGSNINYFYKFFDKKLLYKNEDYSTSLTKVDVVSGCFFIIRTDVIKKVKYFDPNTFLYYEENILAYKLREKKYNTYVSNEVTIKHNVSLSVDKSINSIKKYKILKDSQKYYEKAYLKSNILKMFILRLFYYISLGVAYIGYLVRKIG